MAVDDTHLSRREVLGVGAAATVAAVAGSSDAAAAAGPKREDGSPRLRAPAVDIVCRTCGGNSVSRDAWAEWDGDAQEWVLGSVFDYAYCHDCDDETQLDEVALGSE